jgi:hypothetical protein
MSSNWTSEDTGITTRALVYSAIAAICVVIFVSVILAARPAWMGFEREVVKNSHQYVEGNQSGLLQMLDSYYKAETDVHKLAIIARMRNQAANMPEGTVPTEVQDLLDANPRSSE